MEKSFLFRTIWFPNLTIVSFVSVGKSDSANMSMNAGFAKQKYNYLALQDFKVPSNSCLHEMFFVIYIGSFVFLFKFCYPAIVCISQKVRVQRKFFEPRRKKRQNIFLHIVHLTKAMKASSPSHLGWITWCPFITMLKSTFNCHITFCIQWRCWNCRLHYMQWKIWSAELSTA